MERDTSMAVPMKTVTTTVTYSLIGDASMAVPVATRTTLSMRFMRGFGNTPMAVPVSIFGAVDDGIGDASMTVPVATRTTFRLMRLILIGEALMPVPISAAWAMGGRIRDTGMSVPVVRLGATGLRIVNTTISVPHKPRFTGYQRRRQLRRLGAPDGDPVLCDFVPIPIGRDLVSGIETGFSR